MTVCVLRDIGNATACCDILDDRGVCLQEGFLYDNVVANATLCSTPIVVETSSVTCSATPLPPLFNCWAKCDTKSFYLNYPKDATGPERTSKGNAIYVSGIVLIVLGGGVISLIFGLLILAAICDVICAIPRALCCPNQKPVSREFGDNVCWFCPKNKRESRV